MAVAPAGSALVSFQPTPSTRKPTPATRKRASGNGFLGGVRRRGGGGRRIENLRLQSGRSAVNAACGAGSAQRRREAFHRFGQHLGFAADAGAQEPVRAGAEEVAGGEANAGPGEDVEAGGAAVRHAV